MPSSGGPASGTVSAELTLHGVTRKADVNYRITGSGSDYQVHGTIDIGIADYSIKKPCYLGVCVGNAVKISADFGVHQD